MRQELDPRAIRALLASPSGPVGRDLVRRSARVATRAKTLVKVDHGRLRNSITARLVQTSAGLVGEIGTNVRYARMVHQGTGLYGPRGTPIRPQHGRYLVFTPTHVSGGALISRSDRRVVFTTSVRGQRANPFLKDALPAARGR